MLDDLSDRRAKARGLPGDWGRRHDARLIGAGGRYADLAALSDEWRIAEPALVARWHRLRADGATSVEPSREARHFTALCEVVTPQMRRVCGALRGAGALTAPEIAARLGIRVPAVHQAIRHNAARVSGQGLWRLDTEHVSSREVRFALIWIGGDAS